MFFQSTDEKQCDTTALSVQKPLRNCNKKSARRKSNNKKNLSKKKHRFALTMTSWAENFTVAATWQLKHQLAYWKAKAMALKYENNVLHDIIRKNCTETHSRSCDAEFEKTFLNARFADNEGCEMFEEESDSSLDEENTDDLEFFQANAKYREDARQERELRNQGVADIEDPEAGPSKPLVDKMEVSKELYGERYKKIVALELAVQSKFIEECDKNKPVLWPNIPFNFN